jgi:dihydropteroate synthase
MTRWTCGRFALDLQRPAVMGVLNLTPDSFSDGGRYAGVPDALAHAQQMVRDGAAILDIGAESTRPGAAPVAPEEEWARLREVLRELVTWRVPISVDTRHAQTMTRALEAGADIINDISGFAAAASRAAVARSACGLVVMHMQGEPATMQAEPVYDDVVADVTRVLAQRLQALREAGVAASRLCVDPGYGFGKTAQHNLQLLRRQSELCSLGVPVLAGLSRKSTIGLITGRAVGDRLAGSLAAALWAVSRGARVVRVHDVRETVDALKVWLSCETGTIASVAKPSD